MIPVYVFLALGACLCWATGQTISKVIIDDTDIEIFRALASFSGLLIVVLYTILTGGMDLPGFGLILVAAISGIVDPVIGVLFYLEALKRSQVHLVAPLANTAPLWGVLTGILFLGEGINSFIIVSVVVVILGSYLISGRPQKGLEFEKVGTVLALLAGIAWGVTEVGPTKYCLDNGMSLISYIMILLASSGTVWTVVFLFKRGRGKDPEYTSRGVILSLFGGIVAFFLGWFLWMSALKGVSASFIAPTRGSLVLFAFLLSIIFLKERPKNASIVGMVLILVGVFLVSLV